MSHAQQKLRSAKENNSEVWKEKSVPFVLEWMMFLGNQVGRLTWRNWKKKQEAGEKGAKWRKDTVANTQGEVFEGKQMLLGVLRGPSLQWRIELPRKFVFGKCLGVLWYKMPGRQQSWYSSRRSDGRPGAVPVCWWALELLPSTDTEAALPGGVAALGTASALGSWRPHICALASLPKQILLSANHLFFWQNGGKRDL